MKNQKDFENYLNSKGIYPDRYVVYKENHWPKNYRVVIAENNKAIDYDLASRWWNGLTEETVDKVLGKHYKEQPVSVLKEDVLKPVEQETFEDIL